MKRLRIAVLSTLSLLLISWIVQAEIPQISDPVRAPAPDADGGWVPYGTTYVWSTDFRDVEGLRARLTYLHGLGVRTLLQMHGPSTPMPERRRFLDEAHALDMKVIVRLSGTGSQDPPWGWDGQHFDMSPLATFLAGEGIADHPALLAIYGIHIPWEHLERAQILQFYTEFHQVAGDIPLYHDLVYVDQGNEEDDDAYDLEPGMCDLCEISSMPHTWRDGLPANSDPHVEQKIVRYTSHIREKDPNAQVWIQAQTFQQTAANFRMPTPQDMLWHADTLMAHVDFDGLLWYPYLHSYEQQLGDEDKEAHRQVVRTVYLKYYSDWQPTDWVYIPFVHK